MHCMASIVGFCQEHGQNGVPTSERKYDQPHEPAHLYSTRFPTLCLMAKSKDTNTKHLARNPHHVTEFTADPECIVQHTDQ